ncbi:MAG TPA: VanZ family protein [Thermoanaerobaculia bacterium]|nr:VanZ family protein [Thermoanaerobaculia bacterium]
MRRARIEAALWGGLLFLLTSWPNPPSIRADGFPLDKLTHFLLYAVQALLLYRAVAWNGRARRTLSRVLAIVGTMALWGMLDETHQEWIPGRQMDSGDLFADVSGAAVGALVAGIAGRRSLSF